MNTDNLLKYVIDQARKEYPNETCGYVATNKDGEHKYIPCKNAAKDPVNTFFIEPLEYINICMEYSSPLILCHSHTDEPSTPSDNDIQACNTNAIPWFILSYPNTEDSTMLFPENKNKFIGRDYVYGIMDCYTIVRDFYKLYDIIMLNHYREEDFWNKGYSQYLDSYEKEGFIRQDKNLQDLEFGDMVLFNIRCDLPNHAGIYIGDGKLLHQPQGRLSLAEEMSLVWQKTYFCHVRYKDKVFNDKSKLTRALKG